MLAFQLPLTKKSDATPVATPHWHPNFRNYERLPDTKVVRTTFFLNAASIVVAAVLLLLLGKHQYNLHDLNTQIAEAEADIARNQKANADAIKASDTFSDEEKKMAEAENFAHVPISPVELVLTLGRTLPKEVQIENAEIRMSDQSGSMCILHGNVAGTKDQASGTVNSYLDTLRATPRFAAVFESVSLNSLTDSKNNLLSFEIVLKMKAPGKAKS
ncbi:MAG TPA: hypothetical protein VHD32_02235 [Candidatus Didemnitutus sp.]|nr:hypothetical protein [Candidatus Didemnitutus sp.]